MANGIIASPSMDFTSVDIQATEQKGMRLTNKESAINSLSTPDAHGGSRSLFSRPAAHRRPYRSLFTTKRQAAREFIREELRATVALFAVVLFWTGVWNFLDYDFNQAAGLSYEVNDDESYTQDDPNFSTKKETTFTLIGRFLLIVTDLCFTDAGINVRHVQWHIHTARPRLNLFLLFSQCTLGLFGCILWWDGVYDLLDIYILPTTLGYEIVIFLVGFAVIGGTGTFLTHAGIYLSPPEDLDNQHILRKIYLYGQSIVSSLGGVLLSRGAYDLLCYWMFDESLNREIGYTVVGYLLIVMTNTLTFNAGLTDAEDSKLLLEEAGLAQGQEGGELTKDSTGDDDIEEAEEVIRELSVDHGLSAPLIDNNPSPKQTPKLANEIVHLPSTPRRRNTPFRTETGSSLESIGYREGILKKQNSFGPVKWGKRNVRQYHLESQVEKKPVNLKQTFYLYFRASLAFVASTLFWTGSWNIFSDYIWDYCWQREMTYILVGYFLLLVTRSFLGNAGISPVALTNTDRQSRLYKIDSFPDDILWISPEDLSKTKTPLSPQVQWTEHIEEPLKSPGSEGIKSPLSPFLGLKDQFPENGTAKTVSPPNEGDSEVILGSTPMCGSLPTPKVVVDETDSFTET